MKAIVTGGAGFIGSHVTDRLIDSGVEVVVLDDLSSGKRESIHPRAHLCEADIGEDGVQIRDRLRQLLIELLVRK